MKTKKNNLSRNVKKILRIKFFGIFEQQIPEAEKDENGFLVIPASAVERIKNRRRNKPTQ